MITGSILALLGMVGMIGKKMVQNPKIWLLVGGGGLLAIVIVLGLATGATPGQAQGTSRTRLRGAQGWAPGPLAAPAPSNGLVPFGVAQPVAFPVPQRMGGQGMVPGIMAFPPPAWPFMGPAMGMNPQMLWDPNQVYWPPPLPAIPPALPPAPRLAQVAPGPGVDPAAGMPLPQDIQRLPFQEVHWQGIEVIPLTPSLAKLLKIPAGATGVLTDETTLPADQQGFLAADLIHSVGQIPTPTLESFMAAADRVRDRRRTEVELLRNGQLLTLVLVALQERLGTANGEAAPKIQPGVRPPHGYKGACTNCHHIGTNVELAFDGGDQISKRAPSIRAGQTPPHRVRGECTACHQIFP